MPAVARAVRAAPHIHRGTSTARTMWSVALALLPAAAWGVFSFGLPALRTLIAALVAAVATEGLIGALLDRWTLGDGSAALTGLLLGLTMPPSVPVFVPIVGSVFAVAVAKWAFGGLGANVVNPALAGHLFVSLSWRGLMSRWDAPRLWHLADGVSAATPLSLLGSVGAGGGALRSPLPFVGAQGYAVSELDRAVCGALNKVFGGQAIPGGLVDLVVGNRPGSIGEVSAALLVAGAVFLIARRIVSWEIPAAFLSTVAVLGWIFGGTLVHLLGGGLLLGALFMATDPVTSPLASRGMVLFGVGCGCLTFVIRSVGPYPEGVAFAIVGMNMLVPFIGRITERRGRPDGRR